MTEAKKEAIRETKKTKEKKFRLSCKKLFLTYSQCDLELEDIVTQLSEKLANYCVISYLLSRENHKNDETSENKEEPGVHVHVYIETSKKVNITGCERLHLKKDEKIFKGNYLPAKNKNNTLNYILKEINFKEDKNLLYSKDLEKHLSQNASYEDFDKTILKLVKQGLINEALDLYEEERPEYYSKNHMHLEKSFRDLYVKSLGISTKYDFSSFVLPDFIKNKLQQVLDEKKSLILSGHPGSGKSKFIESYLINQLKLCPLVINNIDSLRFFKVGIHNSIIFDDCSFDNCNREELIKLLDSEDSSTFSVKHSSIQIPKNIPRYLTTNKNLEELLGKHYEDSAITRRVVFVKLNKDENLYLIKTNQDNPLLFTGSVIK